MKFASTVSTLPLLISLLGSFTPAQEQPPATKPRILSALEIVGSKAFTQQILQQQLKIVRLGDAFDSTKMEADIEMNLKAFLKENGYLQCQASWEEGLLPNGAVAVRIQIAEGLQFRLSRLEVKNVKALKTAEVTAQIHLQPGDILNFGEVKRGLARIRRMYEDMGFTDFSYIPEQNFNSVTQTADLIFTIEEGIRYRIAYVGIVGCDEQAEEDRVRAILGLKPGEYFNLSALEAAAAALNKTGLYQELGERDYIIAPIDEKPGLLSVIFYLRAKAAPR